MNLYVLILGLFIGSGLATSLWGWIVILRGRKSLSWPSVAGTIETSALSSEADALLPAIKYRYAVAGQTFRSTVEFPSDITPTAEFARSYVDKYPVGAHVQVYYDPDRPERATLEPGQRRGDWMILALGIVTTIVGVGLALQV